jgi:nicotinamidase-related amidase
MRVKHHRRPGQRIEVFFVFVYNFLKRNRRRAALNNYTLRRQRLLLKDGFRAWEVFEEKLGVEASETALILVDVWDQHWSRGAKLRCDALADKINDTAIRARNKGIHIFHAPSDTMDFYTGAEARNRFLSLDVPERIPEPVVVEDYPLPVDSSDGGSDTEGDTYPPDSQVWTRQTEKIYIDQSRDYIMGNEGDRLYAHLAAKGIKFLLYAGVHTNMCILKRTFAIRSMLRKGFKMALIRDHTDAMYNPARPPYVSQAEGTALVIAYIEKFYCGTIDSGQI